MTGYDNARSTFGEGLILLEVLLGHYKYGCFLFVNAS